MPNPWEKYSTQGAIVQLPPTASQRAEEARKQAADQREQLRLQMSLGNNARETAAWNATHNPDGSPKVTTPAPLGDPSLTGEAYLKTLPANVQSRVRQLLDGRSMLTAREKGQPLGQQLMDAANQVDPNFDETASHARFTARQQFTGMGKGSQAVQAAERLASHVNDLYEASQSMPGPNLGFAPLSNLASHVGQQFDQKDVAKYNTILPLIAGELQKLTKNGSATVDESRHIMANLSAAQPRDVRNAAIAEVVKLGRAQMEPTRQAWESAWAGGNAPPMPMDYTPATQAIFDAVEQGRDPVKRAPTGAFILPQGYGPNGGNGSAGGPNGAPPAGPTGSPPLTPASGPTRLVDDPQTGAQIDAMMNAGAPLDQINGALTKNNFQAVSPEQYNAVRQWMQANPGKAYSGSRAQKVEDLSLLQRAAGSAPGAFLAKMADAFTAGTSTALAGDKGRAALAAMSIMNPDASAAGDILGGITGAATGEGLAAKLAPAALAKYAPRIGDFAYGGMSGFNNAQEGDGLSGAAIGAGAGLVGGYLGGKAIDGVAAGTRGLQSQAVDYLRSRNIPLTVGQVLGQGNVAGRFVKRMEDAATSIPFVGNMVDARRNEGLRAFNGAAYQDAASPIGAQINGTGPDALAALARAKSDAYSRALDPVTINANEPNFIMDRAAVQNRAMGLPDIGEAQSAAVGALNNRFGGAIDPSTGLMSGRGFQEAYRGLGRTARERAGKDYGYETGQVMRQGQDTLATALENQNPGAYQDFLKANAANRNLNILADAQNAAKNQEGGLFSPAQLNTADSNNAAKLTGKVAAATGDRPFADLAGYGAQVLPSRVADSGTATRMLAQRALAGLTLTGGGAGLGYAGGGGEGAGAGAGLGALALAALAAGGTNGVQRLAVKALLDRPQGAARVADEIMKRRAIGTAIGGYTLPAIFSPGN